MWSRRRVREEDRQKAEAILAKLRADQAVERKALRAEISQLDGILHSCGARRLEMYETLVNHKREALVEHKQQRCASRT